MKGARLLPSGVEGLDRILCGGLLNPSSYLIAGGPGTGKTVLSTQIAFRLAQRGEGTLFVSVLTEPYSHLIRNLSGLSFFDERVINRQITFVSAFAILEQQGLTGLEEMLRLSLPGSTARLLILDNIGMLNGYAPTLLDYRAFLQKIVSLATMSGATLLASTDRDFSSNATEYGAFDGILYLRQRHYGLRTYRTLEVSKSRGSFSLPGEHMFEICEEGLCIYPRVETGWLGEPPDRVWDETGPWGVEGLEVMAGGGVGRGTVTGLVGPTGSGKTAICLAFAAAGLREGEDVLYVSHNESPARLRQEARHLGLDLDAGPGRVEIVWRPPREVIQERAVNRFFRRLDGNRRIRLIVDGLDSTRRDAAYPERFGPLWAHLADHLRGHGVTTLFTTEEAPRQGAVEGTKIPWSSIENIIDLQYEVEEGRRSTALRIVKARGRSHATRSGRLDISDTGVRVRPHPPDGS